MAISPLRPPRIPPVEIVAPARRVEAARFGALLRTLRLGRALSQNQLARQAGIDPAYVNRLERQAELPNQVSRRVVLNLWEALDGSVADRERLLVAAGLCPQVVLAAGGWDGYVEQLRRALEGAVDAATAGGADGSGP